MKTGKEIILNHCQTVLSHSIEYLESCKDVENGLLKGDYDNYIDGHCPSAHGLDDYVGQCYIKEIPSCSGSGKEQDDQCRLCWKLAIEKEYK